MRAILLALLFASTSFAALAVPTASACVTLPTCCRGIQVGPMCVQGPTCPPLDPTPCPRTAPLLPDAACTETAYVGPAAGASCHVGSTTVGHDMSCHFSCPNALRHTATEGTGGVTVQ